MNGTGRRVTRGQRVSEEKRAQARRFRTSPTPAEKCVWDFLRGRGLLGLKFRRQQVVAGFIVDFYCAELGLAIELDGEVHHEPQQAAYDRERDAVLSGLGVRTVRVRNSVATRESLETLIPLISLFPLALHGEGVRGRGGRCKPPLTAVRQPFPLSLQGEGVRGRGKEVESRRRGG